MSALIQDLESSRVLGAVQRRATAVLVCLDTRLAVPAVFAGAAAFVFILQFALIFTHEPWLDEWQALQLALQSPTWEDLLGSLRYEGHPPLWYLALRLLGIVLPPSAVLPAAAAILAAATQYFILFRCPFTRAERVLLSLGCFTMFEFLTVSRSLSLGVALLIAAAALWRSRWVWLFLALLPMCDFLFGVLSLILIALRWREKRLSWPGMAVWAASGALAAWTVLPAPDIAPALQTLGLRTDIANYLLRSGLLLFPLQWGSAGPEWDGFPPLGTGVLMAFAFYLFAWRQLEGAGLARLLFWSFVAFTFLFSIVVYPLPARHLMLIALLLVLIVWLRADADRPPLPSFGTWLLGGAACGLAIAGLNLVKPFDTARAASQEIARLGLTDKHWASFPQSRGQGVSALTGIKFENLEQRCMQTFIRWNYRTRLTSPAALARYLEDETAARGRFYLLSDIDMRAVPRRTLRPIAHVPAGYDGQDFFLYAVGPDRPETSPALPDCVPRQRPLHLTDPGRSRQPASHPPH